VWIKPIQIQEALGYAIIYDSVGLGVFFFLTMLRQPALLDVLHMYVILMLVTPAVAFLLTKMPLVALLLSAGCYIGAWLFPAFSYPAAVISVDGAWHLEGVWNMEVLSWQLLFFGSMYAGTLKLHGKAFNWLEAGANRRWAIVALFAAIAVVKVGEHLGYWGTPPYTDKRNLEPLRLLHAILTLMLLGSLAVVFGKHLSHPLAQLLALVGRQTLYGFAASIPATYLAVGFWVAKGGSYAAYLGACAFVIAVVIAVAWTVERRSRHLQVLQSTGIRNR
jgi:hypothetical protein